MRISGDEPGGGWRMMSLLALAVRKPGLGPPFSLTALVLFPHLLNGNIKTCPKGSPWRLAHNTVTVPQLYPQP